MTLIDPAALTSDEAVDAGAVVLREGFDRWGVTGHGLDTTRAILEAAVAAALASQGTGGDDTGEGWTKREHAVAQQLYFEQHANWGYDPGKASSVPWLERARRALAAADRFAASSGSATTDPQHAARSEFGRVTSWLQGQGVDVRHHLDRADDYAAAYVAFRENWAATAPATTDTPKGAGYDSRCTATAVGDGLVVKPLGHICEKCCPPTPNEEGARDGD